MNTNRILRKKEVLHLTGDLVSDVVPTHLERSLSFVKEANGRQWPGGGLAGE